jgi:hypothetical protein
MFISIITVGSMDIYIKTIIIRSVIIAMAFSIIKG